MKKLLFILAALCCCFSVNATVNVGYEFKVNYYGTFRITSTNPAEVELIQVSKDMFDSGATFDTAEYENITYNITSIKQDAFKDYKNSNSRFVFNNLKHFEGNAFYNATCYSIDIMHSPLTELPSSAFYNCHCSRIYLPNAITEIPDKAFQLSNVTEIVLSNITRIESSAFYGCSNLSAIDLSNVSYIGSYAFYECTQLKNVALPECLYNVGPYAFDYCKLKTFSLYNTVVGFGYSCGIMADDGTVTMNIVDWSNRNALSGNSGIYQEIIYNYDGETITGEYTLPTDITALGEGALYHCTALTVINMPASLKQIESKALANCTNLSAIHCNATTAPAVANANAFSEVDKSISIIIPDNAESYYSYTHTTGWKDFTNYQVTLPTIQDAAIIDLNHTAGSNPSQATTDIIADYSAQINAATDKASVEALTQAGVTAITEQIKAERGLVKIDNIYYLLDSEHHTATVTYGGLEADGYATEEYTGNITIPATVEYENATYSVTLIGKHAFQNCTELTAVTFPDDITEINEYAFKNCSKIKYLILPYKTHYIHSYAFSSCTTLKTLELPYMIQAIDNLAFENCSALIAIKSFSPQPSALGYNPFYGISKSITVTVQSNSLALYEKDPWGGFTNFKTDTSLDEAKTNAKNDIITALGSYSSVDYIGSLALNFCQHIEAATSNDKVNTIHTEGVYAVIYSIKAYQAMFGEMGEECIDCPAVEVTKGDKKVTLYNPEKVEFIKVEAGK